MGMSMTDNFALKQALANIKLENFTVDSELLSLFDKGMHGELTTVEIISLIING